MNSNSRIKFYERLAVKATSNLKESWAAENQALRLVENAKIAAHAQTPPTDLNRLTQYMQVLAVREVPLAMNGRLVAENDGICIEVNSRLTPFRKRFVVAHELAHLIIEHKRLSSCLSASGTTFRQPGSSYHRVERLCDLGAAEILLPASWLRDQLQSSTPSLTAAARISKQSDCDLDFVATEAVRLQLWGLCRLLWWTRRGSTLLVSRVFPEQDESSVAWIEPLDIADSVVGRCLTSQGCLEGNVKLASNTFTDIYRVQCISMGPNTVLSVLIFNKAK